MAIDIGNEFEKLLQLAQPHAFVHVMCQLYLSTGSNNWKLVVTA